MTREEAIDMCMEVRHYLTSGNPIWDKDKVGEALDMAIEALKRVSFENDTEIKSCSKDSDLISREAAKDIAFRSPFFSDALMEELDALPSADRPTDGDLISRADAIEAIEIVDWYHQNQNKDMVHGANDDEHQAWYKADDVYKALEAVPSASSPKGKPKTGKWINTAPSYRSDNIVCDQCGYNSIARYDYCPDCGADMRGDTSKDLIIKGAGGIKDGLYVIKDSEIFKYKSKGGTVRTYPIIDRPIGEWTLLTEERPVDNYEIITTVYWPGYGDSIIAVGHIDRFDNWHLYSPTEGELIKGFEVIAWKTLPEPYCGADMRGDNK